MAKTTYGDDEIRAILIKLPTAFRASMDNGEQLDTLDMTIIEDALNWYVDCEYTNDTIRDVLDMYASRIQGVGMLDDVVDSMSQFELPRMAACYALSEPMESAGPQTKARLTSLMAAVWPPEIVREANDHRANCVQAIMALLDELWRIDSAKDEKDDGK